MPTKDGISDEDWDRVIEVAADIANCSEDGEDTSELEAVMSDLLGELEAKYGRAPSVIATRADYTDDPSKALALYEEAYLAAEKLGIPEDKTSISSSIAELYIGEMGDISKGKHWLDILERNMAEYSDEFAEGLLEELKAKIAPGKKKRK